MLLRSKHCLCSIQPIGLFFWGSGWTMAAWCELRRDFRPLGEAAFAAVCARLARTMLSNSTRTDIHFIPVLLRRNCDEDFLVRYRRVA